MTEELEMIIREISAGDQLIGSISQQILNSYRNKDYFLSFLGLGVLVDQSIRLYADMAEGRFEDGLQIVLDKRFITESEANTLGLVKNLRDQINNAYMYSSVIELPENGEMEPYPFHEDGTWEKIVTENIHKIFVIISNLKNKQEFRLNQD